MKRLILIIYSLIFLIGCEVYEEPIYSNPRDPLSSNFGLPEATLSTVFENDAVIIETTAEFNWEGLFSNSSFSYKLVGYDDDYSDWIPNKSVIYNYLDEGKYTFLIKEKAGDFEQTVPDSTTFTIDAVQEPSLVLKKWHGNFNSGSSFTVDFCLESIDSLSGLSTKLIFSNDILELTQIESFKDNVKGGADAVALIANEISVANSTGIIEIDLLLLGDENAIFTGNASLCRMHFNMKSNSTATIRFDAENTKIRDIANKDISIDLLRGSFIN